VKRVLLVLPSAALLATAASAQTDTLTKAVTYSVPSSPAFALIGTSPSAVSRPGTARELAIALVSAIDTAGALVQGFALELSPALVVAPTMDLLDYREPLGRILANTTVSLGTTRAATDSSSTRLALGFRSVLIDRSDPMLDAAYVDSILSAFVDCIDAPSLAEAAACASEAEDGLLERHVERRWNAAVLAVGAAVGWDFQRSELSERVYYGTAAWAVGGLPVGRHAQVLGQLQYQHRGREVDEPGSWTYGGRAYFGSARVHGFGELIGQRLVDAPPGADVSRAEWSGGVEFRAGSSTWVTTGLGARFADSLEPDRMFLLAGLRWGASTGPALTRTGP